MTLIEIKQRLQQIEEALIENGGEATPEMEEALEIAEKDFLAKLAAYRHALQHSEAKQSLLKQKAEECKAEAQRMAKKDEWLKLAIYDAVKKFGVATKTGAKVDEVLPDGEHLYIRVSQNKPKAVIKDRANIPKCFWAVKTTRTIDTTAIRDAIINGEDVKGATIKVSYSVKLKK